MKQGDPTLKHKVTFSHIAAASENNVIGREGQLPWHIPEDLRFFHKKTKGKALIMGRKTFESLGQPLSHRLNVVVTGQKNFQPKLNTSLDPWAYALSTTFTSMMSIMKKALSVVVCSSIEDAMEFCSRKEVLEKHGQEIFISGGGEIYKQTLLLIQRIYLTRIHKNFKGDAFYPEIPKELFQEAHRKDIKEAAVPYSFITYERKVKK